MSKFHNNVKTALLLGLMTGLILFIGSFFGTNGLITAGAISMLGYMFMFGGSREERGAGVLTLLLGPRRAGLIQAAISRSREYNADKVGAEILGDPMPLATALEKIHAAAHLVSLPVNPAMNGLFIAEPFNGLDRAMAMFQTHPPLEARLRNLIGRESTGRLRYAA